MSIVLSVSLPGDRTGVEFGVSGWDGVSAWPYPMVDQSWEVPKGDGEYTVQVDFPWYVNHADFYMNPPSQEPLRLLVDQWPMAGGVSALFVTTGTGVTRLDFHSSSVPEPAGWLLGVSALACGAVAFFRRRWTAARR